VEKKKNKHKEMPGRRGIRQGKAGAAMDLGKKTASKPRQITKGGKSMNEGGEDLS